MACGLPLAGTVPITPWLQFLQIVSSSISLSEMERDKLLSDPKMAFSKSVAVDTGESEYGFSLVMDCANLGMGGIRVIIENWHRPGV